MPASDSHAPTPPADTPNAATPVPPHGTWSGRFAEPMSERMQRFNASVDFDQRLARADIAGSLAHARMLAAQGILPRAGSRRSGARSTAVSSSGSARSRTCTSTSSAD